MTDSFAGISYIFLHRRIVLVAESAKIMDWAGFEPATSRLRSEHYYP